MMMHLLSTQQDLQTQQSYSDAHIILIFCNQPSKLFFSLHRHNYVELTNVTFSFSSVPVDDDDDHVKADLAFCDLRRDSFFSLGGYSSFVSLELMMNISNMNQEQQ